MGVLFIIIIFRTIRVVARSTIGTFPLGRSFAIGRAYTQTGGFVLTATLGLCLVAARLAVFWRALAAIEADRLGPIATCLPNTTVIGESIGGFLTRIRELTIDYKLRTREREACRVQLGVG